MDILFVGCWNTLHIGWSRSLVGRVLRLDDCNT